MARTCFLLTFLLLPLACGGSAADRLKGTWVFDVQAMKDTEQFRKLPAAQQQMMLSMIKKLEITFTGDQMRLEAEFEAFGKSQKKSDASGYKVVSEDGDKLVLEATDGDNKGQQVTVRVKGDKLIFEEGAKTFALKRK